MAISGAVQTLSAAFSFGILLQAASGVLLIYWKGHGSTIFQDGRRLVLMLFLFFAALWAQTDFINLMIPSSPTACQVTLVFSTLSDQLARVGMGQFLLWSVGHGTKITAERLILQAILAIRFVVGLLLVGFTRPDFAPVCVARTSVLPIAIVILALDIIIIGLLVIRALLLGMFKGGQSNPRKEQSKVLILSIAGFTLWTGTSAAMLLGLPKMLLIVRTTLPSTGLLILVGIVAISPEALLLPGDGEAITPEARSPFMAPSSPSRGISPRNIGNGGSPISGLDYMKSGRLRAFNPSATPHNVLTTPYPRNYEGDARGFTKLGGGDAITRPTLPSISQQKRSIFNWSKQPAPTIRSLGISQPVVSDNDSSSLQHFARVQTIDLATAAIKERERREGAAARSRLVAKRPAPPPPLLPAQEGLRKSISVKRKVMSDHTHQLMPTISSSTTSGLSVNAANGNTTSASLSPGREDVRRRSPRNINSFGNMVDGKASQQPTLQMKQTIGLPSGPKSQRITLAREAGMGGEPTVMFMNDIVYDNPGMVDTIIRMPPRIYTSTKKPKIAENSTDISTENSYAMELKSSGSILHRPRPYQRDATKDRALFPSDPSSYHRRSQSGSSIVMRKSIFASHSGSPTQLPPLPAPPTRASKLQRPMPNSSRSMTFDEKIQLLFPAPPGSTLLKSRRSSVPSLLHIPSLYMPETPPTQNPTEVWQQGRRVSKGLNIASFGPQGTQSQEHVETSEPRTYRFSPNTYRALADKANDSWIPGTPSNKDNTGNSMQPQHIRSSPAYDIRMSVGEVTSGHAGSCGDPTTSINKSNEMRDVQPTIMQQGRASDPEIEISRFSDSTRQSFFHDANQVVPRSKTPTSASRPACRPAWHWRVGDEPPTFSARKSSKRPRKMPPPTPLLLTSRSRKIGIVVHSPAPSPIDSPERAIKDIQAQLKRFEESIRGSVGSLLRHMPGANSTVTDSVDDERGGRFRLLESLEKEMGQQENQWQQMQFNLRDRNSMSDTMTPQQLVSPDGSLSQRSSLSSSRIVARRAHITSSMAKGECSSPTISTQSSDCSRASIWQQRLAEAQMQYSENAPALLRGRSLNYLLLAKSQGGSPTPPESIQSESDVETGSDSGLELSYGQEASNRAHTCPPSLWQPEPILPRTASVGMWNPPCVPSIRAVSPEAPARDIRPARRLVQEVLPIFSSALWSKPSSSVEVHHIGLWRPREAQPSSVTPRRATQKPQRKSRRATLLPDIVESPLPLPHKRDTLGIFQFPWGETSDSAVYQPPFNPGLHTNPVISTNLDARSRHLEPEPTEYSSSFFDDYDEQDDDEYPEIDEDLDSDDDFDETTLWEIASLLVSTDVPSRNSLLPPARQAGEIFGDYNGKTDLETEEEDEDQVTGMSGEDTQSSKLQLPIQSLALPSREGSKLWAGSSTSALGAPSKGLPQPDWEVWKSYLSECQVVTRFKPKPSGSLPVLATCNLWTSSSPEIPSAGVSALWSKATAAIETSPINPTLRASSTLLWTAEPKKSEPYIHGLFSVNVKRSTFRTTQANPAAASMIRRPRSSTAQVSSLTSQGLWAHKQSSNHPVEWILRSTAAEATPQHNHDTSSGGQAPKMWTPVVRVEVQTVVSLFTKSVTRSDYRTTNSLPAAITMVRKPRAIQTSLDRLTSTQLWNGSQSIQGEHDWISESSVRPESPSVYSEASSGGSSPISDSSSVKSNSTKASSLWGPWWGSKSSKKLIPRTPPHSKDSSSLSARQPISLPLATLRESRVLTSQDHLEAETPVLKDTIVAITPKTTLARPVATKADWDSALAEAILQSRPRMQRPRYSPEMWAAALREAITLSAVPSVSSTPKPYDVATRHPVFFSELLVSSADDIHPAAMGHVVRPTIPSVRIKDAHMWSGLSARTKSPTKYEFMWSKDGMKRESKFEHLNQETIRRRNVSKPLDLPSVESSELWKPIVPVSLERNWLSATKGSPPGTWVAPKAREQDENSNLRTVAKQFSPDMFSHIKSEPIKRAVALRPSSLPILKSRELFKPMVPRLESDIHWLHSTSKVPRTFSRAQTWTAPLSTGPTEQNSNRMWESRSSPAISSPSIFSDVHIEPWHRKKREPTPLKEIESCQMWRLSTVMPETPKHWLVNRRVSRVEFRY